jgi:hypothetical protein
LKKQERWRVILSDRKVVKKGVDGNEGFSEGMEENWEREKGEGRREKKKKKGTIS